jgi:hypothetical protein
MSLSGPPAVRRYFIHFSSIRWNHGKVVPPLAGTERTPALIRRRPFALRQVVKLAVTNHKFGREAVGLADVKTDLIGSLFTR